MDSPGIIVLNGWAASPDAWSLCGFMRHESPNGRRPALYSYVEQLDGLHEQEFDRDGRFVVVGWSMGGSSALRLAIRNPEKIAGLVLVAATPRMMEEAESGWVGMSPRRLEVLRRGLELTHGQGLFGPPEGKPNPYMVDDDVNLERGLKYLRETDLRADLERTFRIGCSFPVHIFQSDRDGIVRSSNAHYLSSIFTGAHLTMMEGSEHALPICIPDAIDTAVYQCGRHIANQCSTACESMKQ